MSFSRFIQLLGQGAGGRARRAAASTDDVAEGVHPKCWGVPLVHSPVPAVPSPGSEALEGPVRSLGMPRPYCAFRMDVALYKAPLGATCMARVGCVPITNRTRPPAQFLAAVLSFILAPLPHACSVVSPWNSLTGTFDTPVSRAVHVEGSEVIREEFKTFYLQ